MWDTQSFFDSMRFSEKFDKKKRKENLNYEEMQEHTESVRMRDEKLNDFLQENLPAIVDGFIRNSTVDFTNACHAVSHQFYINWMKQRIGELCWVAVTVGDISYDGHPIYMEFRRLL